LVTLARRPPPSTAPRSSRTQARPPRRVRRSLDARLRAAHGAL